MAGELSDKQKQKLEQYEERIKEQDNELEEQRKQLVQLSALVDEQQKEINSREDKLTEQQKVSECPRARTFVQLSLIHRHRSDWKVEYIISLITGNQLSIWKHLYQLYWKFSKTRCLQVSSSESM